MSTRKQWQPTFNSRYGRNLRQFIDAAPVAWGKGTKLSKRNAFPHQGFTALLIACVAKDRAAGEEIDEGIAAYVDRVYATEAFLNGHSR